MAYIPTTSRKNPQSKYWSGHGGKGGTIKNSKKDNEELISEVYEKVVKAMKEKREE